jgi:hypothetical protein
MNRFNNKVGNIEGNRVQVSAMKTNILYVYGQGRIQTDATDANASVKILKISMLIIEY